MALVSAEAAAHSTDTDSPVYSLSWQIAVPSAEVSLMAIKGL